MINYYVIEKLNYYQEQELLKAAREHWKFAECIKKGKRRAIYGILTILMKLHT